MEELQYPIGRFQAPAHVTPEQRAAWIETIATLPAKVRAAVAGLTEEQLNTPYRPDGWTVRQLVHHIPDSHLNSYIRFKLALTEEQPTIKTYEEKSWANLPEARTADIEVSLTLLDALHQRWTLTLKAMTPDQFARTLQHPELGLLPLDWMLALYEWHCRHHTAHITNLRERMAW